MSNIKFNANDIIFRDDSFDENPCLYIIDQGEVEIYAQTKISTLNNTANNINNNNEINGINNNNNEENEDEIYKKNIIMTLKPH